MKCLTCDTEMGREEVMEHECDGMFDYPEHLQYPSGDEYDDFELWFRNFLRLKNRRGRYRERKVEKRL